jgi:glutamyl-tRNA reductase
MIAEPITDISSFFVAGINYRKSDASIRGQFSINSLQYEALIHSARKAAVKNLFVLSTCNRTEIYGCAEDANMLANLLCSQAEGSIEDFSKLSYTKKGLDAIEHLFNVAAGLDSQILGDYEIVGQIKTAVKFSKQFQVLDAYLERMINEVLAASKNIRSKTHLSSGTVSVSYAAVQCIKQHYSLTDGKNILLVGAGKIGGNTCRNIMDYLPGAKVTILNRSEEKAAVLANEHNLQSGTMDDLDRYITAADMVIVATNAPEPVLLREHLAGSNARLVIDLSVPCNVDPAVSTCPGVTLVNIDDLSRINDETLLRRAAEIPAVKDIIKEHISYFIEWHQMRKHVPVLKMVKDHLLQIQSESEISDRYLKPLANENIQKVINGMAVKMRQQNQRGCQYIEAMNDYIATASN